MSVTTPPKADDVFFCPRCGQKHRGDLSAAKAGVAVRARCVGCGTGLSLEWRDGQVVPTAVDAAGNPAVPPRAAAPARAKDEAPDASKNPTVDLVPNAKPAPPPPTPARPVAPPAVAPRAVVPAPVVPAAVLQPSPRV